MLTLHAGLSQRRGSKSFPLLLASKWRLPNHALKPENTLRFAQHTHLNSRSYRAPATTFTVVRPGHMSDNAFAPGSRPRGDRACAAGLTQIMSALIGVRCMRRNLACPP